MFHLLAFIFLITPTYAEPIKPTTEAFWKATNDLTGIATNWISNYKKRKFEPTDPMYKELEKPENIEKIKEALKQKWAKEVESQLTEKEIVYLTQLYSHSLMNKMNNFDIQFWSPKLNSIIDDTIKPKAPVKPPTPSAPAPSVAPAKTPAPAPAPKK